MAQLKIHRNSICAKNAMTYIIIIIFCNDDEEIDLPMNITDLIKIRNKLTFILLYLMFLNHI